MAFPLYQRVSTESVSPHKRASQWWHFHYTRQCQHSQYHHTREPLSDGISTIPESVNRVSITTQESLSMMAFPLYQRVSAQSVSPHKRASQWWHFHYTRECQHSQYHHTREPLSDSISTIPECQHSQYHHTREPLSDGISNVIVENMHKRWTHILPGLHSFQMSSWRTIRTDCMIFSLSLWVFPDIYIYIYTYCKWYRLTIHSCSLLKVWFNKPVFLHLLLCTINPSLTSSWTNYQLKNPFVLIIRHDKIRSAFTPLAIWSVQTQAFPIREQAAHILVRAWSRTKFAVTMT